ncbi:MAG: hypothetical protein ABI748_09115, partial [Dokdonella sp.]
MNTQLKDASTSRQEEVAKLVRTKVAAGEGGAVEAFVERYLAQVDPEELADRKPADLYGAALSHWNFARTRNAGGAKVRVFNPTIEEHGWQSTHTVVEIVNDDMPFLVDSVTMEVNRHGLTLHLILHPILSVDRKPDGTLVGLAAPGSINARRESFIHVEVDRIADAAQLAVFAADIERVLGDVRSAVNDWEKMRAQVGTILEEINRKPPPLPADELAEGKALMAWLADNHFTFLG